MDAQPSTSSYIARSASRALATPRLWHPFSTIVAFTTSALREAGLGEAPPEDDELEAQSAQSKQSKHRGKGNTSDSAAFTEAIFPCSRSDAKESAQLATNGHEW